MKGMSRRKITGLKSFVMFTLITAMLVTLIPANAFADSSTSTSTAHETEDPNAKLYPFPLDMSVLSNYLYGSPENAKGKVVTRYPKKVPAEWLSRDMPPSLKAYRGGSGYIGRAVVHTTRARIYFYPGVTSVDYHKKRIEELSQTAYSFQGAHSAGDANLAFYCAEYSEFKVIAYNALWIAIWSEGGIDVGRGLSSACGGIGTEQYGSWKPGIYFIPRRNCYITDVRNQASIPEVTMSGKATCNIYVKTTPASDDYVAAGLIESNQLFQITKSTPINGHYQIYFKQGLYYVNATYVNRKVATENKPAIQCSAVVKGDSKINITSQAKASSSVEGVVKKDAQLEVVKKNYGNGYSQVWFNSKRCYIPTKNLKDFDTYTSLATIKKLGKAKGKLVLDSPWSGNGATVYTEAGLKLLKKYEMNPYYGAEAKIKAINGSYRMEDGDSAPVYKITKYTYTTKDFPGIKEKTKIYKMFFKGKVCYITDQGHIPFNYYPGSKYSKKITSKTKRLWVYGDLKYLETYRINDWDYFKLDDIAQMMAVTNKSFHVKYDTANDAIIINGMSPYKGKTTSMKKGDGKKHKVVPANTNIVWDGRVLGIPCYKINGNYYVTAHDIAELTDSRIEDISNGWRIMPTRPNKIDAVG